MFFLWHEAVHQSGDWDRYRALPSNFIQGSPPWQPSFAHTSGQARAFVWGFLYSNSGHLIPRKAARKTTSHLVSFLYSFRRALFMPTFFIYCNKDYATNIFIIQIFSQWNDWNISNKEGLVSTLSHPQIERTFFNKCIILHYWEVWQHGKELLLFCSFLQKTSLETNLRFFHNMAGCSPLTVVQKTIIKNDGCIQA